MTVFRRYASTKGLCGEKRSRPLLNTHGYVWTRGKKRSKLQGKLCYFRRKRLKRNKTNHFAELQCFCVQLLINIISIINININKYIRNLLKYRGKLNMNKNYLNNIGDLCTRYYLLRHINPKELNLFTATSHRLKNNKYFSRAKKLYYLQ